MTSKVQITQAILDGIVAVQESGVTNMFVWGRVVQLLDEYGFEGAGEWVADHPQEYGRLIMFGADVLADNEETKVQDIGA